MRRALIAGAGAGLAGAVLAVAVSAHTTHYESTVGMSVYTSGTSNNYFWGAVISPKAKCEPDRKVTVLRQESGPDVKFGSDISHDDVSPVAPYTVTAPSGDIPPGDYYSKIKRRDLRKGPAHDHICDGAKSPTKNVGS